ncbi:uncharacterized protein LOC8289146 [Ricinus communis]|uniref:Uncharacterized protein n=1 Tax=Ricinus communis TaxID=3988 RepID=B9RCX1_RICCO|nr:uncharacterized protein LOC8289146 [Ricinus communis]EEF50788.1 conserved hypothetical protein [Ricinus communis]|eukprot:XP_002512119.1 uncharacterized protein LOC8289146 [Ricinus communis]
MKSLFQIQPPLTSSTTKLPITEVPLNQLQIGFNNNIPKVVSSSCQFIIRKSLPFAASAALLLSATPASAGFMSGISGLESVPGPELPQIDFLNKFNEENQKKYAENDARFQSSPILKELLERSKQNKEKNRQAIQDKYCIRGAEWGVGDCSTDGMSPAERDNFIAMLKEKAGIKD